MRRSQVETLEAAWMVLKTVQSERATAAAQAIVLFLEEIDDDGVIDRFHTRRSPRSIILGIISSLFERRLR